jgi:MinD-like ATPase involved in chromosome partitioning or flagellar assembly
VNLALSLKDRGKKVGLLDADFSASNVGYFIDLSEQSMGLSREEFHPVAYEGLQVFSIPLVLGTKAVSMVGSQFSQLLTDAVEAATWDAEYMVVDLPPGFGDELKTAAKIFSDSLLGSIIVSQPAHHLDARRALQLHRDLEIPIIGLIENMSHFQAGAVKYAIFGESTVDKLGEEFEVPVLGRIPLSMEIRQSVEKGDPRLKGEFATPIENAVEKILVTEPKKPGFLERLREMVKDFVDKLIIEMALSINRELDIGGIQKSFGYPGGSIIRLNIMNDTMDGIVTQCDWMVQEGKLVAVDGDYEVDAEIDITPKAMKWAILGNRTLSDGSTYNFESALRLGDMRLYGRGSMAKGAYFMKNVFEELRKSERAMGRIRPILERL